MTERLQRLERLEIRSPIYFVTACTFQRKSLLADAAIQARLLEFAEHGPARGAWMGAFVLMPDHLHLFVTLAEPEVLEPGCETRQLTLSEWMKSLKNALSKVLRDSGIEAPHWQKGFLITFCGARNRMLRGGIT